MKTTKKPEGLAAGDAGDAGLWSNLRFRFGILLALALLPWLLLTALEAVATLDRNRGSQAQLADVVATNAVDEVGRTLEAGRLALDAAPQLIAEFGCEEGAANVLDRLGVYSALIIKDDADTPSCQMPASLPTLLLERPDEFADGKPFRIERGRLGDGDVPEQVVVLQRRIPSTNRTYTLVLPQTLGLRDVMDAALGEGWVIALTKPDGRSIVGMDTTSEANASYRSQIGEQATLLDIVRDDGEERRIASRYFRYLDLYVTVGRPTRFENVLSFINPYTSVLLPLLAWVVGFGLIWLGTQSMLLTPIRKVRRATRQFATGELDQRVDLSAAAAAEVQGLATSFNDMAQQLEERDLRLADNMDEKDTLLREIHHRVKNNLQIIISLLNMQERKAETEEAVKAIAETRARINAIAVVHRGLYESDDLRAIDVGPFVARLMGSLSDSLGLDEAGVELSHNVEAVRIPADNAIPVALFIVEAVSNAKQHGVARGGRIQVDIDLPEPGELRIDVSDDGCGMGDPSAMRGIGTRLMQGFARQLGGTLDYVDNAPGLKARLRFPIDDSPEQPFQVSRKPR
ncbi:MAG: histidine kinase dimerization/phosphoacceptor domain -containing protein [Litorimonas sp.]